MYTVSKNPTRLRDKKRFVALIEASEWMRCEGIDSWDIFP